MLEQKVIHPIKNNSKNSKILLRFSEGRILYNIEHNTSKVFYEKLHNRTLNEATELADPSIKHLLKELEKSIKTGQEVEVSEWNISLYNSSTERHENHSYFILIQPIKTSTGVVSEIVVLGFELHPQNVSNFEALRLQDFTKTLSRLLEHKLTADLALQSLIRVLNIETTTAFLFGIEEGRQLRLLSSYNTTDSSVNYWKLIPLQKGLCPIVDCVLEKAQFIYKDSTEIIKKYPNMVDWIEQHHGYAVLPLIYQTRISGGIVLKFPKNYILKKKELSLLESLTEQTALALERSVTYQSEVSARKILELQNQEQDVLTRLSKSIFSTLQIDQILNDSALHLCQSFFSGCLIGIYPTSTTAEKLVFKHMQPEIKILLKEGLRSLPDVNFFKNDQTIQNVLNGKLSHIHLPDDRKSLSQLWPSLDYDSQNLSVILQNNQLLFAPILRREKVIGCIVVFLPKELDYNLSFYEHLAFEATVRICLAIENALLYYETKVALATRDEFFSIASHELKTPITTLKLQSQLRNRILQNNVEKLQSCKELFRSADLESKQIEHLSQLINNMLDVVRIQEGKLLLTPSLVNLCTLARDAAESFAVLLDQALEPIELQFSNEEILISCDPHKINQAINNLLSNALKYGLRKRITLRKDQDEFQVFIHVKDQGSGIRPEDQSRIFERFERLDLHHNIRGLGLGLYVVKKIIDAHQGSISIESRLGEGTQFTIQIPKKHEQKNKI